MSDPTITVEIIERRQSARDREDLDTKADKMRRAHTRGWRVELADGGTGWVDQIDVRHVYLHLIDGLPIPYDVTRAVEEGVHFVRERFHGPAPVVLGPDVFDPGSAHPVLPPLRFAAQISSWRRLAPTECGSWINLVWFAEIDDRKPLTAFVNEALSQVDWARQASGFET